MDYKLAKKLKDAGFPQGEVGNHWIEDGIPYIVEGCSVDESVESIYIPTLEELIEACGDWFWSLNKIDGMWYADAETEQSLNCDIGCCGITGVKGSTPSEAVANLWLELNKK